MECPGPLKSFWGQSASLVGAAVLVAGVDWTHVATAFVAAAGVLVLGILPVLAKLDQFLLERKKRWDSAKKEMIEPMLAQSVENQEAMRESLHAIRNDLQAAKLENTILRTDLEESNRQVAETTRHLVAASQQVARLTADLARFRRDQPEAVKSAVREAIGESQHEMPAHRSEEPPK